MSSANRGATRNKDDFYATPKTTIKALLDIHPIIYPALEPSCGKGAILDELNGGIAIGCDINPDFKPNLVGDYLSLFLMKKYNTIITNPPFKLALEFIEKALGDVEDCGQVIMLLRINFLESKKRKPFWQANPPSHIYVLSSRPSFTGNGTDSTGYAWFVWTKGRTTKETIMNWL